MRVWQALHPRDRRALAIGTAMVTTALSVSLVIRPLLHARNALQDRLREQRGLLARELGLIDAIERLPENSESAADELARFDGRLFPDRDPLAATAALVNVVGESARRQGVLLESIEAGAPEAIGGTLLAVRVDVRGRSDVEGLLRWVAALEGSRRLLRVDQLTVARVGTAGEPDSSDVEVLSLTATVRGVVLAVAVGRPSNVAVAERRP